LYSVLPDVELRALSLQVISIIGISDTSIECKPVSDLVRVLHDSGGTAVIDPDVLDMRRGAFAFPLA
jgi:hypothetical protein